MSALDFTPPLRGRGGNKKITRDYYHSEYFMGWMNFLERGQIIAITPKICFYETIKENQEDDKKELSEN